MDLSTTLANRLKQCEAAIVYEPLEIEVAFNECPLFATLPRRVLTLPKDQKVDPFEEVGRCIKEVGAAAACILIPGKTFDLTGTRHGRSFGWYDRLLSKVPPEWLRIGTLHEHELSDTLLVRQSWDEPMDWLVVSGKDGWKYIETKARSTFTNLK